MRLIIRSAKSAKSLSDKASLVEASINRTFMDSLWDIAALIYLSPASARLKIAPSYAGAAKAFYRPVRSLSEAPEPCAAPKR